MYKYIYMILVYNVIVLFFRGGRLFCFSFFCMIMKFWYLGCVKLFYGENMCFVVYFIFLYMIRSIVII